MRSGAFLPQGVYLYNRVCVKISSWKKGMVRPSIDVEEVKCGYLCNAHQSNG